MKIKLFRVTDILIMATSSALVFYLMDSGVSLWIGYVGGFLSAVYHYHLNNWRNRT